MARPTLTACWLVMTSLFLFFLSPEPTYGYLANEGQCEPVTLSYCHDVGWNNTMMPNFFGHVSQAIAREQVSSVISLARNLNCHEHLMFFICSLLVPMCSKTSGAANIDPLTVYPCQSLCFSVKGSCEDDMKRTGLDKWPENINCTKLPVQARNGEIPTQLCMKPPPTQMGGSTGHSVIDYEKPGPKKPSIPGRTNVNVPSNPSPVGTGLLGGACYTDRYRYTPKPNSSCASLQCHERCKQCEERCGVDHLFTRKDKELARVWSGFWAVASGAATLSVLATFAAKPSRFQYPVRPVVCMVVCHFVIALGHILRLFLTSEDVICRDVGSDGKDGVIITDGKDNTLCIILFLIHYYFSLAAHIWWVILTLAWFLAAAQKWGVEAIRSLACYFHLVAWSIPAILAITVLVTGAVDADELAGSCSVGNKDPEALLGFVVAPLVAFLMLGIFFLFGGFISLIQVRRSLKHSALSGTAVAAGDVQRLEKLMAKIGLFSIFYVTASACLLGSLLYEYTYIHEWRCAARRIPCVNTVGVPIETFRSAPNTPPSQMDCHLNESIPKKELFLLKTCVSVIMGVLSSMWIFNSKTVDTWRSRLRRCCVTRAGREKELSVTSVSAYGGSVGQRDSVRMLPPLKIDRSGPKEVRV